jgi:hypothetical protein
MKAATKIFKKIEEIPKGEPFISTQFLGFGPRASIDQALSRLVKNGVISRIARGLFVRPEMSQYVGKVIPGLNKVIEAYARAKGITIQIQGAEAVRRFGLSTQMPVQPVFNTSGPSRKFKLGELNVTLKHVSPKKLVCPGSKAGQAITALWYLGKENINASVIETIMKKMLPLEFEELKVAIPLMPAWMADAFHHYEREKKRAG